MNLKIFLYLFVAVWTVDSFAITGRTSWLEMRKNSDVMIQQPTFAGVFGAEGLFNACTTDDEFRSINPFKNCLEYREVIRHHAKGNYKDYVCVIYETKQVSISRTYKRTVCSKFSSVTVASSSECLEYKTITSLYPTTFSFAVIEASSNESGEFLFNKTFALQSCE